MKENGAPIGYVTRNGAAEWINLDQRTIRKIIIENGLKRHMKVGRFDYYKLSEIVDAMVHGGERLDLQQERARLAKKQTEKASIQIEQLRGELVDAAVVMESWSKQVISCRAKLLSMPTKMASEVLTASTLSEAQDIIKFHINEALTELSGD